MAKCLICMYTKSDEIMGSVTCFGSNLIKYLFHFAKIMIQKGVRKDALNEISC